MTDSLTALASRRSQIYGRIDRLRTEIDQLFSLVSVNNGNMLHFAQLQSLLEERDRLVVSCQQVEDQIITELLNHRGEAAESSD